MNPEPFRVEDFNHAEVVAAAHMQAMGFADAELTARGRDGGIDVVADRAIAQVKWQAAKIGSPLVQKLGGVGRRHSSKRMLFFSKSDYTDEAREYADGEDMALFVLRENGDLEAINDAASKLLQLVETPAVLPPAERPGDRPSPPTNPWSVPRHAGVTESDPFELAQQRRQAVAAPSWTPRGRPANVPMGRTALTTIRRLVILFCVAGLIGAVANPETWIIAVPAVCALGGLLIWWWLNRDQTTRR